MSASGSGPSVLCVMRKTKLGDKEPYSFETLEFRFGPLKLSYIVGYVLIAEVR